MAEEGKFTREQELLKQVRDTYCGGVNARLAAALDKNPTYVNRLFYPAGKDGRKGIGLEIMRAASKKFHLPPGYWEGADTTLAAKQPKGAIFEEPNADELEMLDNFRHMHDHDREELAAEIAKRAARAKADMDAYIKRWGLTPRPASASAKAAAKKTRISAEPTNQTDLDLEPRK
jgi:hypothetical protein